MQVHIIRKRLIGSLVALAVAGAGLLAVADPAVASENPNCALIASPPEYAGAGSFSVSGMGIRDGCVQNRSSVTVRIRKDIPFGSDQTVASHTVNNVVNVTVYAIWHCSRGDGGNLFTEIYTNAGGSAQSTRRGINCL